MNGRLEDVISARRQCENSMSGMRHWLMSQRSWDWLWFVEQRGRLRLEAAGDAY